MNLKVIRNYNDANKLLEKGFQVIKIDRDKRNRKFLVFIFENSDELIKELNSINT